MNDNTNQSLVRTEPPINLPHPLQVQQDACLAIRKSHRFPKEMIVGSIVAAGLAASRLTELAEFLKNSQ